MISPTTREVERAVRFYVARGSGLAHNCVIPGNDNSPTPNGPFATVLLTTEELPDGFGWSRYERVLNAERNTIDMHAFASSQLVFSVQFFRSGASDYARRFATWTRSPAGVTEASRRGLTVYRTETIRNLDEVDDEFWEERRQLDLVLGLVSSFVEDVGLIETLDVDLRLNKFVNRPPPDYPIPVRVREDPTRYAVGPKHLTIVAPPFVGLRPNRPLVLEGPTATIGATVETL